MRKRASTRHGGQRTRDALGRTRAALHWMAQRGARTIEQMGAPAMAGITLERSGNRSGTAR